MALHFLPNFENHEAFLFSSQLLPRFVIFKFFQLSNPSWVLPKVECQKVIFCYHWWYVFALCLESFWIFYKIEYLTSCTSSPLNIAKHKVGIKNWNAKYIQVLYTLMYTLFCASSVFSTLSAQYIYKGSKLLASLIYITVFPHTVSSLE